MIVQKPTKTLLTPGTRVYDEAWKRQSCDSSYDRQRVCADSEHHARGTGMELSSYVRFPHILRVTA